MVSANVVRRARTLSVGETLTLSPQEWVRVPPGFAATPRARLPGATRYREDRPERPLVIRRSGDRIVVARERYHPRYHPGKYAALDALPAPLVTGAGRVGAALGRAYSR